MTTPTDEARELTVETLHDFQWRWDQLRFGLTSQEIVVAQTDLLSWMAEHQEAVNATFSAARKGIASPPSSEEARELTVEEVLDRLERRSLTDLRKPFKLRHDEFEVLKAALSPPSSEDTGKDDNDVGRDQGRKISDNKCASASGNTDLASGIEHVAQAPSPASDDVEGLVGRLRSSADYQAQGWGYPVEQSLLWQAAHALTKAQSQIKELVEALGWLVELKDVTKKENRTLYEANKDAAWARARSALLQGKQSNVETQKEKSP